MVLRAGKGFEGVGKGIYPLLLNRFVGLGKGKRGITLAFVKKPLTMNLAFVKKPLTIEL